jgi:threonine 3-dehydrogenase
VEKDETARMRALSKLYPEPGIWMTEVEPPAPGHNDLLIRIDKTAICGTDMHIYHWDEWSQSTIPVPMVVGHEYVGEVVGMGQEVRGFNEGDRARGILLAVIVATAAPVAAICAAIPSVWA